jgi:DNA-binding NtrC family response regulator
VDDEPLIRWSLAESLVDCGHEVTGVADGRSAIGALVASPEPFDVVLLDLRLPDSNDLSLLARIRRMSPRTQVILMTAFGSAETLQGALDLGAFQVVSKPFEIGELARLVLQAHGTSIC